MLIIFYHGYYRGKNHFEEDGTQNYLVFQLLNRYSKVVASSNYISSWKSKDCLMKLLNRLQHLEIV